MKYKIVADSSCDLTEEMKRDLNIEFAPLKLQLRDQVFVDDASLNIKEYLKAMKECPDSPKTACPSPQDFMECYSGDEPVFVLTISKELSGTHNSALLAKTMYQEDHPEKFIHVFNTRSASAGETLTALKIKECVDKGLTNEQIVEEVEAYIESMHTFFLLESLDHLAKAGRLNHVVAKIASLLSLKPIMGATEEGLIKLFHKVRGYNKAFSKFVDTIGEFGTDFENRTLAIAHCNCYDRAVSFKEAVEKQYPFKEIIIVEMAGLSSTYADDGGLVIAF
jgi:DegV family protein with EDD domain